MKAIISLLLLISTSAFAGHETGNGGDVIVCRQQDGNYSYELLDLYEMRETHGFKLDADSNALTPEHKAVYQLNKISNWAIYDDLIERVQKFKFRIKFIEEDLIDIPDSYHTYIPSNCEIRQLAINYMNGVIEVDKKLWSKLDIDNKSALILHELFYEDMILTGFSNSIATRYINAHLHASSNIVVGSSVWWRWNSKVEATIWKFFGETSHFSSKELVNYFLTTPYIEIKVRLFKKLMNYDSLSKFTPTFVKTLVNLLKNNDIAFEREIVTALNQFISAYDYKWIKELVPLKVYLLNKTEYVVNNVLPEEYVNFLYYHIESDTIGLTLGKFLSKFEYNYKERQKVFEMYEKFLTKIGEDMDIYQAGIVEDLFYKIINTFDNIATDEFKIIEKDFEILVYKREFGFIEFVNNLMIKNTLPESLLTLIYNKYINEIDSRYDNSQAWKALKILWESDYKRKNISNIIGQYFRTHHSGRLLNFILEVDRDSSLYNRYKNQIKEEFIGGGKDWYFSNMYQLRPVPQELVNHYVFKVKTGELSLGSGPTDSIFKTLIKEENVNDKVRNLLAYKLRYSSDEFYYVYRFLIDLKTFSPYLYSAITQEIKINLQSFKRLSSLLEILRGKKLTKELVEVVTFIYNSTTDVYVKKLAKEVLGI